jgi:hypothetical protein
MRVSCSTVSRAAASPPRAERRSQRAFIASREADQAGCILAEIVKVRRALALCRFAHLELRDQLTKILIALARCAEQRQARRFLGMLMRQPGRRREPRPEAGDGNLGSDVRANGAALSRWCESGPHRRRRCGRAAPSPASPAQPRARSGLRLRCSLEQAEGARRVQLDIPLSHRAAICH